MKEPFYNPIEETISRDDMELILRLIYNQTSYKSIHGLASYLNSIDEDYARIYDENDNTVFSISDIKSDFFSEDARHIDIIHINYSLRKKTGYCLQDYFLSLFFNYWIKKFCDAELPERNFNKNFNFKGYTNHIFLESIERVEEDNPIRELLETHLQNIGTKSILRLFYNPNFSEYQNKNFFQTRPVSYKMFCENIAGDFFSNYVNCIEQSILKPKERFYNDQFILPETISFQVTPELSVYFNISYDTCKQYRDNTSQGQFLLVKDEDYYSTNIRYDKANSIGLETKYIIKNVKMKDFSKNELRKFLEEKGFPYGDTFQEYIRFLNNMKYQIGFFAYKEAKPHFTFELENFLKIFIPSKIKSRNFINHTHIIGRSGSGKSELLKAIIKQMRKRCILIDPHGDIADSLDRKHNFRKIAPMEQRFVINPFDIKDKSLDNRELVTEEIIQLLQEIIQDSNVSVLMKTIAFPIISTLLKLSYADFRMFADCINPISGIKHLERLTPLVDDHLKLIWEDLKTDTYDTTKRSIFNRLQSFLNKHKIVSTVCGYDDFGNAMGYVEADWNIVVSLPIPLLGEDVSEVLGRFFMCRMQIWAKRRQKLAQEERKPVLLIVDECQNYLSEETARTLDQFGRKFGLYMVLAHQHIGQIDGKGLKGSMLANCKNKIVGYCDDSTISIMSKAMGVPPDEFKDLKSGHFWGLFENQEPLKFYSRMVRYKDYREQVMYVESKNTEFLNGWELVEDDINNTAKNEHKTPKFTAKFDL